MIDTLPITRQRFGLITHLLQLLLTENIKNRKLPTRYLLNINNSLTLNRIFMEILH